MADNTWKGFSNIPLRSEDKAAIKEMPWTDQDCLAYLTYLAELQYKVTITLDTMNDAFIVSATGRGKRNVGVTMSQRHSNLSRALACHNYADALVDGIWPLADEVSKDYDW